MMDKVRHMVDENMDIHEGYDDRFGDWRRLTRHIGCGWMTETERFLVDRLLETELAGSSACKSKNTEIKIKLLVCGSFVCFFKELQSRVRLNVKP